MTTCTTCKDTHRMFLDGRAVMCTKCPTPCQGCRHGGTGAYCRSTPCTCLCHAAGKRHEDRTNAELYQVVMAREDAHRVLRTAVQNVLAPFKDELDRKLVIDGLERIVAELRESEAKS